MDTIEARENEMVDQLARLIANNVSKNAEIQNLKIMVQERVEVDLTFDFYASHEMAVEVLLLIPALCSGIFVILLWLSLP